MTRAPPPQTNSRRPTSSQKNCRRGTCEPACDIAIESEISSITIATSRYRQQRGYKQKARDQPDAFRSGGSGVWSRYDPIDGSSVKENARQCALAIPEMPVPVLQVEGIG